MVEAGVGSNVIGIEPLFKTDPNEPDFFPDETKQLTDAEIDDLVAFMLTMTDRRVQCRAAPFDHPALSIPDGHLVGNGGGNAKDFYTVLPATGAAGTSDAQCFVNSGDLFIR